MNIDGYNTPRPSVLARKKLDDEIKALKKSIEMLQKANKYGVEAWRLAHLENGGTPEHDTKKGGKENE